jgi:hypothetical protein
MPFSQITSNINFPPLALPTRGKFRVIVTSLSLKITLVIAAAGLFFWLGKKGDSGSRSHDDYREGPAYRGDTPF